MPRSLLESRIPWPRDRLWRPGESITLDAADGTPVAYRLRGVMRDHDPASDYATVLLEPIGDMSAEARQTDGDLASAAG